MKARTKFLKMFYKLPKEARSELVYDFIRHPMTMHVIKLEIEHKTTMGNEILARLGYKDD